MTGTPSFIVAVLYPGDRAARSSAAPSASRFGALFDALAASGIRAEPAVYHDDFAEEVEAQLYRFQRLRLRVEEEWVTLLRERLGVTLERLPLLWDADFLLGERNGDGDDRYVLCEINVSSVSPYPASANMPLIEAVRAIASKAC